MSLPHTAEVLVVGGGPTGLVAALALSKNGCPDVVVVDAATQVDKTSRATALHAATMEALEKLGVAELLLREGGNMDSMLAWTGRDLPPAKTAHFGLLAEYTKYPFITAVPQHVTERILITVLQELGVLVHRPHRVVSMVPNEEDSELTDISFDNGHVLRTRCVVGADGARSTVRRLSNVAWSDPQTGSDPIINDGSLSNMIVADITLSLTPSLQPNAFNLLFSPNNSMLFVALPGTPYPDTTAEQVYRIACGIPSFLGPPPSAPDTPYLQKLFDAWGPNVVLPADAPRLEVTRTLWSSRFRPHSAIAERFFTHVPTSARTPELPETVGGPVLLLGDAAHIHPPMGGQGMNLGIRDAAKLAPILAEYLRTGNSHSLGVGHVSALERDAREGPLLAWATERRKRALAVIAIVERLRKLQSIPDERMWLFGVIPYNPGWMRNVFLRTVTKFEWFQRNGAWRLSGLWDL